MTHRDFSIETSDFQSSLSDPELGTFLIIEKSDSL